MNIRLILLSIVGLVAYIALASFNSKIIKESETPKDRAQVTAPQAHVAKRQAAETGHAAAAPQPQQKPQPQPPQVQPPQVQLLDESLFVGTLQQMQDELARKDQQIKQLLDAQESIVARERAGRDAAAESEDQALAEQTKRLETLTAEKERMTAELDRTKALVEQLRREIGQQRQHAAETANKALKEQTDKIAALTADRDQSAAESKQAQAELAQLRHQVAAMQTAGAQTEQSIKEKGALLAAAQQQIQHQTEAANQLKAQLAETADQLAATQKNLAQAEHQTEALARLNADHEQRVKALDEQKTATAQALAEKQEALDKALLSIQSLKGELLAQPQAVATVQALLDERTREFDRINKEAANTIEQLNNQVASLGNTSAQSVKELEQCAAEADKARKEMAGLEADRTRAQAAQAEAERKLTTALEDQKTLQAQLTERETALDGIQGKISGLTAEAGSLRNEKIGLASQLTALQADHNGLLAMKHGFEEQAAALAKAESGLKEMPALRAKNEEMSKSLAEKDTALAQAAQQAEAGAAAGKQLEQEKADLAGQLAAAQTLAQSVDGLKKTIDEQNNALALAGVKVKELDSVKEQAAAAQAKAAEAESARLTAEKNAAESEAARQRCNESLTASSATVKKLEDELSEAQARIKELPDTNLLQEQQKLIVDLRGQITATEANSDAIKAANQKAQILQTERDGLQQALVASQTTIDGLRQQLAAAKAGPPPAAQAGPADRQAAANDSDRDGVVDGADLCPDTPAGVPVNALGCPREKAIVLEGVVFSSGTAILAPESQKELDRIAAALAQAPRVKLEVAGYTDSVGENRRNQRLSAQRAQAVVVYLTGKGVAAARLTANGYGAENPIGDNATAEGRQKNRRIELHVLAP